MSARRSMKRTTRNSTTRARRCKYLLEGLETRVLFNTIITDTDPLTITQATETLEFKDARGKTVRITVHGDVSAEFIFARVTKGADKTGFGGNDVILGDAVNPTNFSKEGKLQANPEDGRDLFHVFIAQASIDSYIAIAEVPVFSAQNRPMQPFAGSVSLVITPNAGNEVTKATAGGTGGIYLGARTRDTDADIENEADRPIRTARFNGQGLLPVTPNNRLVAGVTTAAGVSIGKFMFGGAVSGQVKFGGSIETWYCGALLTGTTEGQFEGTPLDPGNFFVQGDIRNILVKGAIGTHDLANDIPGRQLPTYFTGTDFNIHGRVGQIRTGGDYLATGIIHNDNPGLGLRTRQQEIEFRIDPGVNRGSFTEFENGQFGDNEAFFNNDSIATAQYLGSINSKQLGVNSIQLNGVYQRTVRITDLGDFYGVALMAGQKVTVRLIAPDVFNNFQTKSLLHCGVFDPDQRLIATDYSDAIEVTTLGVAAAANNTFGTDFDPAQQELFSFTAAKPGTYYIAVSENAPTFTLTTTFGIEQPYQLQLTGIGNLGLGGLVAADTVYAPSSSTFFFFGTPAKRPSITGYTANIDVENGDLGAVVSLNDFIISNFFDGFNALADTGNLRYFNAVSLGLGLGAQADNSIGFSSPARIGVLRGSVGMIRSTGTDEGANITYINALGRGAAQFVPTIIGGDIQYIVSPTFLLTDLECNGSIGVVQARDFGNTLFAGSLSVNVDGLGKPGTIDLIDVTGDLGTLNIGGPTISTNDGGNVRYIHISDTSTAFRPRLFGSNAPELTTFVQGQEANFTDDSGTQVTLTPTFDLLTDAFGNPIVDVNGAPLSNSGTLTVLTYPIARSIDNRGAGGVVIVRVDSTRGVKVTSNGTSAEIGTINCGTADPGPGLVFNADADPLTNDVGPDGIADTGDDPFELDPNSTNTLGVDIRGAMTDVFTVQGSNFASIRNRTTGEIVNTRIGTVGLLEGENLGFARSSIVPGMRTEGSTNANNPGSSEDEGGTFPFNGAAAAGGGTPATTTTGAKNALVINGGGETLPAAVDIKSRRAIGNVMVVGRVQNITANSDNKGVKGVYEGIVGDVYAKGQIRNVQIGEGLLPSGSGEFARAGLYCNADNVGANIGGVGSGTGRIERVINQGLGSDIRGNIVAAGGVGTVQLNDGSIINSSIFTIRSSGLMGTHTGTGADFTASREFSDFVVIQENANIDQITVTGAGGIIGLITDSANLLSVTSTGGFGIANCVFIVLGTGRFGSFTADGLGIRGVLWDGGQSLENITVNGNGHRLTTSSLEPSLLFSGSMTIDPFFGTKPTPLTDLYVLTGTSPTMPQRKGVSASGSLDLSEVRVSRDLGSVTANTIRATNFSIGNNISSITTRDYTGSMEITAGRMDSLTIGSDALGTDVAISGPIGTVNIGGSFKGSSRLAATGPNGSIASFTTGRTLYGNVSASKDIGSIRVGTHYGSQGTHAGGGMREFMTGGDFSSGALLDVNKTLNTLVIGGNFQDGATVRVGLLGTKTVIGDDLGDIVIG